MTSPEDQHKWQQAHERIVSGDVIAFAELCEYALPFISNFLKSKFPDPELSDVCDSIAIDSLLRYQNTPEKYDSQKSKLSTYLCMDARGDMLNELEKIHRRKRREVPLDDEIVELASPDGNKLEEDSDDWISNYTSLTKEEIMTQLDQELTDIDKRIVISLTDGIRDTKHYAQILGIDTLPDHDQRIEVKRAKDRVKKTLERFGKRKGK